MYPGFVVGVMLLFVMVGCAGKNNTTAELQSPNCEDALTGELSTMADAQVATLLDETIEEQPQECWVPIIQQLLTDKRNIPLKHLTEAINEFNKQRYAEYFHQAVYRYLAALAKGDVMYDQNDRILLESYASYTIRTATSSKDSNMRQAQLLCRKLDNELYAKLFE
jgi:hypothetical protein